MTASATTTVSSDILLDPLQGEARSIEDWVTTFHLSFVVLDPFTRESAILVPTAGRILQNFSGSNCRMAWLLTGTPEQALEFMDNWTNSILTFCDPDRVAIKELGLAELPAFVHINQGLEIVGLAQGWNPADWREVSDNLAKQMKWSRPEVPTSQDPPSFHGTSALN